MSTVDFFVAVVMILSVLLSVLRGFTREVLTLVSLVGAVAVVAFGMPLISQVFGHLFEDQTTANIAGGAIVGLVTLVILSLIGHQIGKAVTKSGLGPVDRVLGSLFGVARAALLLCILYIGIREFAGETMPAWITEAKATPIIAKTSDRLVALLPPDIQSHITPDTTKDKDKKPSEDVDDDDTPEKPSDVKESPTGAPPTPPEKPGETSSQKPQGYDNSERDKLDNLIDKGGKTK